MITHVSDTAGWVAICRAMDEAFRPKRSFPLARFWRFIGRFMPVRKREECKRYSGMAVLERPTR